MVEIDTNVIELCKKYFPKHSNNSYKDPRLKIVIDNGLNFIKKQKKSLILLYQTQQILLAAAKIYLYQNFIFTVKIIFLKMVYL